jgi:hypothetical protein
MSTQKEKKGKQTAESSKLADKNIITDISVFYVD